MSQLPDALGTATPPRTPFEMIGGEPGVRRLAEAFYDIMDRADFAAEIRAMHAPDLTPMRERFTDWLVGWMGGPRVYALRHPGRPCVVSAHQSFAIDGAAAEQWLKCMRQAFDEVGLSAELKAMLDPAFKLMAEGLRNVAET